MRCVRYVADGDGFLQSVDVYLEDILIRSTILYDSQYYKKKKNLLLETTHMGSEKQAH